MSRTIFREANLLDGESPARAAVSVVVDGDRIAFVGDGDAAPAAPGDREIELAGRTLMPGLVLSHFHSTYDGITIMPEPLGLENPPGYLMLVAANNVRKALHCGFTSIVSAGAINDEIDVQLKAAIDDGVVEGPRMLAGGRGLDTTGGYTDTGPHWWELGNPGASRFCDGPDEFRAAVRAEISRGVEIVKLFPSGGHGVHDTAAASAISEDEMRAAAEAAHQRGKKVRAHCSWRHSVLECVRAGVDVIDHGDEIDRECIDAMVAAGTTLVPGMFFLKQMLGDTGNLVNATPEQMAPIQAEFDNLRKMLPVAQQAGVNLCVGDDYGIIILPHGRYAEELEFYVKEVGIAPLDVIRWATRNGAKLMGREDEVGSVSEGKLADLLVVDGDPSVDIAVLQDRDKLLAIMKGGALVKDHLSNLETPNP
ncbi:MAG: amidohydrolase family protein [Myxococcales bacterium]|nr:amidohydrolase family protein [Myxococcales bacterium]